MPIIGKTKNHLVIKIPLLTERYNPYMDESVGMMPNIVAVISGRDMGFCYRIDMSYKRKDDQWTDFFFKWFGEQDEFEKLCAGLGFDTVYSAGYNHNLIMG